MVLLEWCVAESPYKRCSPEEKEQIGKLRQALVLLLHQLLLCHLLDPDLDMDRIVRLLLLLPLTCSGYVVLWLCCAAALVRCGYASDVPCCAVQCCTLLFCGVLRLL